MNDDEYFAIPVIPVDVKQHNDSGFCFDMSHECHENKESVNDLQVAVNEGEITRDDADRIYRGKTV